MTKRGLLLAVGALLVAAVSVVTTLLVTGGGDTPDDPLDETRATPTNTATLGSMETVCLDAGGEFRVRVYFGSDQADEDMRRAADALRADARVAKLATETRAEAYERFKEIFENEPELVELARPESLPASVELQPADGISTSELAADLEDELTGWSDIEERACEV